MSPRTHLYSHPAINPYISLYQTLSTNTIHTSDYRTTHITTSYLYDPYHDLIPIRPYYIVILYTSPTPPNSLAPPKRPETPRNALNSYINTPRYTSSSCATSPKSVSTFLTCRCTHKVGEWLRSLIAPLQTPPSTSGLSRLHRTNRLVLKPRPLTRPCSRPCSRPFTPNHTYSHLPSTSGLSQLTNR